MTEYPPLHAGARLFSSLCLPFNNLPQANLTVQARIALSSTGPTSSPAKHNRLASRQGISKQNVRNARSHSCRECPCVCRIALQYPSLATGPHAWTHTQTQETYP